MKRPNLGGGTGSNQYATRPGNPKSMPRGATAALAAAVTDADDDDLDEIPDPRLEPPPRFIQSGTCEIRYVDGKWVSPRCGHAACRSTLRTARTFTERLDGDADLAVEWINAGCTDVRLMTKLRTRYNYQPSNFALWRTIGKDDPYTMHSLQQTYGTVENAKHWLALHPDSRVVNMFANKQFSFEQAKKWIDAGITSAVLAESATKKGMSVQETADWFREWNAITGAGAYVAEAWLVSGDPQEDAAWHSRDWYVYDAARYREEGLAADESKRWRLLGVGAEEARIYHDQGILPDAVEELVDVQHHRRGHGSTQRTQEQSRAWLTVISAGGDPQRWQAIGVHPELAAGCTRWGITPDQVSAVRAAGTQTVTIDGVEITVTWGEGRTRWTSVRDGVPVDMELEQIGMSFSATPPKWMVALSDAKKLSGIAVSPGDSLEWAARGHGHSTPAAVRDQQAIHPFARLHRDEDDHRKTQPNSNIPLPMHKRFDAIPAEERTRRLAELNLP